ncbi:MAG: hypothetical protein H6569_10990, partial [Lewinellaceae bacterium]|nr:hypothetical protein [Lewinellaceae bacterium]
WTAGGQPLATLNGHSGNVYFAEFASDNQTLLTRASDGTACTWALDGTLLASFPADHNQYLLDARLCSGNNHVVLLDAGGHVELCDAAGRRIARLGDADVASRTIELAADGGDRLLVRENGTKAALYATADGRKLAIFEHPATVKGLRSNTSGTRVLTWASDYVVRLWDEHGQLLQSFNGHRGTVTNASMTVDGSLVLSTALDGTVKLWDKTGNILIDWPVESNQPIPARFSPDGQFILVSEKDNKRITRLPLPETVYENFSRTIDRNGPELTQLATEYHIQFLDNLPK